MRASENGTPAAANDCGSTSPTAACARIEVLDFIRGIAVLGILVINIESFAFPDAFSPVLFGFDSEADRTVRFWVYFLFQGKFFSMFALLFGVGFCLFLDRRLAGGVPALDLYARRMLWLFLFGVAHAYLIWNGDILFHYAVCGLLLLPLRGFGTLRLCAVLALLTLLILLPVHANTAAGIRNHAAYSEALAIPKAQRSSQQQQLIDRHEARHAGGVPDRTQATLEARSGGWVENLIENSKQVGVHRGELFNRGILFRTLFMMTLGILLLRLGVFSDYRRVRGYWVFTLGLTAFALLINFDRYQHWTYAYSEPLRDHLTAYLHAFPKELMGLAYVLLANGLYQRFLRNRNVSLVSGVGKMALSNYLMQSVICALLFFGYGLGLHNQLSRLDLLPLILAIWIFQLIASALWLRRFDSGPMESLWRRMTYGRWSRAAQMS